jgi:hypothetical protein
VYTKEVTRERVEEVQGRAAARVQAQMERFRAFAEQEASIVPEPPKRKSAVMAAVPGTPAALGAAQPDATSKASSPDDVPLGSPLEAIAGFFPQFGGCAQVAGASGAAPSHEMGVASNAHVDVTASKVASDVASAPCVPVPAPAPEPAAPPDFGTVLQWRPSRGTSSAPWRDTAPPPPGDVTADAAAMHAAAMSAAAAPEPPPREVGLERTLSFERMQRGLSVMLGLMAAPPPPPRQRGTAELGEAPAPLPPPPPPRKSAPRSLLDLRSKGRISNESGEQQKHDQVASPLLPQALHWRPSNDLMEKARDATGMVIEGGMGVRALDRAARHASPSSVGYLPGDLKASLQTRMSSGGARQWRPSAQQEGEARLIAARNAMLIATAPRTEQNQPNAAEIAQKLSRYRGLGLWDFDPKGARTLPGSSACRADDSKTVSKTSSGKGKLPKDEKVPPKAKQSLIRPKRLSGPVSGSVSALLSRSRASAKHFRGRVRTKPKADAKPDAADAKAAEAAAAKGAQPPDESATTVVDGQAVDCDDPDAPGRQTCSLSPVSAEDMLGTWRPVCTCKVCTNKSQLRWLQMFESSLPEDVQSLLQGTLELDDTDEDDETDDAPAGSRAQTSGRPKALSEEALKLAPVPAPERNAAQAAKAPPISRGGRSERRVSFGSMAHKVSKTIGLSTQRRSREDGDCSGGGDGGRTVLPASPSSPEATAAIARTRSLPTLGWLTPLLPMLSPRSGSTNPASTGVDGADPARRTKSFSWRRRSS